MAVPGWGTACRRGGERMSMGSEPEGRAQVALARVPGRKEQPEALARALHDLLEPLGGLGRFVPRGSKVLLKPNQTLFKSALSGSTTSPRLIRVLIEHCFAAGAREVWVAESAGHAQMTRQVMARTGMAQAVQGTGAHVIYLDEIAHGVYDFGADAGELRYLPAPEILERADVLINVPKAKTHFVDPISGACKNWVGVMPMATRLYLQRQGDAYYRGNALYLRRFRPTLNLFDGAVAGQGQGPGQNQPFWWGHLLASTDPVAADVMLCRLFGLPWLPLRMAREAAAIGVGLFDPDRIDLLGVPFATARVSVHAADPGVHRYPCRVLVGKGATIEGTLGHWKTIADAWLENGLWTLFTARGRPTFMFGAVEDPDFEAHLREGPYVVLGDTCLDRYKYDPRVVYVPGWPVPQSYLQQEMVAGMGFGALYAPGLKLYQAGTSLATRLKGAAGRPEQRRAAARVAGAAALAVAARLALGRALGGSRRDGG